MSPTTCVDVGSNCVGMGFICVEVSFSCVDVCSGKLDDSLFEPELARPGVLGHGRFLRLRRPELVATTQHTQPRSEAEEHKYSKICAKA